MQIACTQCSAKLNIKEHDQFLVCQYCSSALFLDGGRGADSWYVKPILDEAAAIEKTLTLLLDMGARADQITTSPKQFLVPFREGNSDKSNLQLATELVVALDGLKSLQGEREAYTTDGLAGWEPLPIKASEGNDETFNMVHYPMFQIDYLYGGNEFVILIDGITGNAFADDIPTFAGLERNGAFFGILLTSFLTYIAILHVIPGSLFIRTLVLFPALLVFGWVTARIVVHER